MKISCQSCQAKYTIADEKVLGKIVKIRCKKCGATIVINGNEPEASASSAAPAAATSDPGFGVEQDQWTVNVADGDQRTMTVPEIVEEYKAGAIQDDTFCWKDGMNDWLPLREIESLYASCTAAKEFQPLSLRTEERSEPAAAPAPSPAPAPAAAAASPFGGSSGFGAGADLFGGAAASASTRTNGNGGGLFDSGGPLAASPVAAVSASAARRTGGRGNQADLFGGVAQAGGEEDVMTSAAPVGDGSKLTGQRNENSVLFSLGSLTQKGPEEKAKPASASVSDGSGLIDIRALASSTGTTTESAPKSSRHVDDIMNLGGGGAFSAALAAPVLAPPQHDISDLSPASVTGGSNRTLLIGIIVGCLLLGGAAIVAALLLRPTVKEDAKLGDVPTASASASAIAAPAAVPSASAAAAPADSASAGTGGGAQAITPGQGTGGKTGGSKWAGGGGKTGGGGATAPAAGGGEETHAAPAAPAKPADLAGAMNAAVGGPAPEAHQQQQQAASAPFDRGAAQGSLGNIDVTSCKKPDGPTGGGHLKVTFQPSGTVSAVDVDSPPFSGTAVGGCIAAKFRSAHVPPFSGGPVTVGKSFSLN